MRCQTQNDILQRKLLKLPEISTVLLVYIWYIYKVYIYLYIQSIYIYIYKVYIYIYIYIYIDIILENACYRANIAYYTFFFSVFYSRLRGQTSLSYVRLIGKFCHLAGQSMCYIETEISMKSKLMICMNFKKY